MKRLTLLIAAILAFESMVAGILPVGAQVVPEETFTESIMAETMEETVSGATVVYNGKDGELFSAC